MNRLRVASASVALTLVPLTLAALAASPWPRADARPAPDTAAADAAAVVARGRYIAEGLACADCHTPWTMGPDGPVPDAARAYSGHPESLVMPPAPELPPGPWVVTVSGTNTAWAGPWGVSFTANLTPDPETGIGSWTEDMFVAALRSGRHLGMGRAILPPMPWPAISKLDDADLKAVFAFLRSLPPIHNRVPEPVEPRG